MRIASKHSVALILTVLTPTALVPISGCQYAYRVELRGSIYSAKNGAPLGGVRVFLSPEGAYGRQYAEVFPVVSGEDGRFSVSFTMPDVAFMGAGPWSVSLEKEGYHDETIDLGPFEEPQSSEPTRIVVAATMREKS